MNQFEEETQHDFELDETEQHDFELDETEQHARNCVCRTCDTDREKSLAQIWDKLTCYMCGGKDFHQANCPSLRTEPLHCDYRKDYARPMRQL